MSAAWVALAVRVVKVDLEGKEGVDPFTVVEATPVRLGNREPMGHLELPVL